MSNQPWHEEEREYARHLAWDVLRQFRLEASRDALQALLDKVREVRALNSRTPMPFDAWTDMQAPLADLAERVMATVSVSELWNVLTLLALEACGDRVHLGRTGTHG